MKVSQLVSHMLHSTHSSAYSRGAVRDRGTGIATARASRIAVARAHVLGSSTLCRSSVPAHVPSQLMRQVLQAVAVDAIYLGSRLARGAVLFPLRFAQPWTKVAASHRISLVRHEAASPPASPCAAASAAEVASPVTARAYDEPASRRPSGRSVILASSRSCCSSGPAAATATPCDAMLTAACRYLFCLNRRLVSRSGMSHTASSHAHAQAARASFRSPKNRFVLQTWEHCR